MFYKFYLFSWCAAVVWKGRKQAKRTKEKATIRPCKLSSVRPCRGYQGDRTKKARRHPGPFDPGKQRAFCLAYTFSRFFSRLSIRFSLRQITGGLVPNSCAVSACVYPHTSRYTVSKSRPETQAVITSCIIASPSLVKLYTLFSRCLCLSLFPAQGRKNRPQMQE